MPKILWVLLPLLCYCAWLLLLLARQRLPNRMALNVHTSLLLIVYLLGTAGLGLFWVASQQLPVFDWHYLFGYCTLLLLLVHLSFNLPMVLRWLRRPAAPPSNKPSHLPLAKIFVSMLALLTMFWLGTRHNTAMPVLNSGNVSDSPSASAAAVIRYHEFSSESRSSVFRRAQGVEWGAPPPEFKHYPGVPTISLPKLNLQQVSLSSALRAPGTRRQPLRLDELGEILYLTAGITASRGGNHYRAAPSSGALFPSEVYLQVRRVQGLAAAWYHYDPQFHRLQLLPAALLPETDQAADNADLTLVVTAIFHRTAYKYRDRAYRYAAADAGHLLENLRLASHASAMQAQFWLRFDEAQIADTLAIDSNQEGVLAMMSLRQGNSVAQAGQASFAAASIANGHPLGVTGMVQQATSLQLARAPSAGEIRLPATQATNQNLYANITQRRSQRRFTADKVSLAKLSTILADMQQASQLSAALDWHLVVNRVEGLAAGVYRYRRGHTLQLVRSGELAQQAQAAALAQDVIGDAAVVLVISADKNRLLADGARGYRHALLEAGLVGERWLLSAVAQGLGACPVGAFYDDEAASLLQLDQQHHWVLHFAALGVTTAAGAGAP